MVSRRASQQLAHVELEHDGLSVGRTARRRPQASSTRRYFRVTSTFQNAVVDGGRSQPFVRVLTADAPYHSPKG